MKIQEKKEEEIIQDMHAETPFKTVASIFVISIRQFIQLWQYAKSKKIVFQSDSKKATHAFGPS